MLDTKNQHETQKTPLQTKENKLQKEKENTNQLSM